MGSDSRRGRGSNPQRLGFSPTSLIIPIGTWVPQNPAGWRLDVPTKPTNPGAQFSPMPVAPSAFFPGGLDLRDLPRNGQATAAPALSSLYLIFIYLWLSLSLSFLTAPSGLWDLSSPTRYETQIHAVQVPNPNYWTTRELPQMGNIDKCVLASILLRPVFGGSF